MINIPFLPHSLIFSVNAFERCMGALSISMQVFLFIISEKLSKQEITTSEFTLPSHTNDSNLELFRLKKPSTLILPLFDAGISIFSPLGCHAYGM